MKIQFIDEDNEYKGSAYLDMRDGTKEFIYEWAVLELVSEDILFVGCGDEGYLRTTLMVECNDIFSWGTADCEDIPAYELKELYDMWKVNSKWGVVKWCCLHRNMKPQAPVIDFMKKEDAWDEIMENLPENSWEKEARARGQNA